MSPIRRRPAASIFIDGGLLGLTTKNAFTDGIGELVEFSGGILPSVFRIGVDVNLHQFVIVELRDLDVGRENRHADGDFVAAQQQLVFSQRLEDIGDARRAALDGEQVQAARRRRLADQLLHEVMADDLFRDRQHPRRRRVAAAKNA